MTVEEVLRQSGFGEDQIRALDPKAITAFSGVLDEAQKARNEAMRERQANIDFYEQQIAPSLNAWSDEKAKYDGQLAFYRAQVGSLRASGLLPDEYEQPRDPNGRYVAGAPGATPGSPTFDVNKIYERAGDAIGILTDIQWEHQRLFGQPLPISPSELVKQADAVKLDPRTYAARTFNWDTRRKEMEEKRQQEHDSQVAAKATAENDRKWAERVGSNPDVRFAQPSRFSDAAKAVRTGNRPDPLTLDENTRRAATRSAIRTDLAEEAR